MSNERDRQSAAAAAAEHVRSIVEAAERETEAQLQRMQRAAEGLAGRADEIEAQLERLTEGVRDALQSLREELRSLRLEPGGGRPNAAEGGTPQEIRSKAAAPEDGPPADGPPAEVAAGEARPEEVESPEAPVEQVAPLEAAPEQVAPVEASPEDVAPVEAAPTDAGSDAPAAAAGAGATPAGTPGAGHEGARVIALNMALSGSSREEIAAYLAENFELDDPEALLEDVFARAGHS